MTTVTLITFHYPRVSDPPTVIDTLRRNSHELRACVMDFLSPKGFKNLVSIICSYAHPSKEDLQKLERLRQRTVAGRIYAKDVMVYAHMLAKAVGGPDLLGYNYLFQDGHRNSPRFIYGIEEMVVTGTKMNHDTIISCYNTNSLSLLSTPPIMNSIKDRVIDESYLRCIPSNASYVLVTCPYCLDAPIKYSYYRGGHRKTKKHILNKESALKKENYYRYLLERFQPDYESKLMTSVA